MSAERPAPTPVASTDAAQAVTDAVHELLTPRLRSGGQWRY